MESEIKAEFEKSGFSIDQEDQNQILQQCVTFCINFKLSPADLVSSWEIYYLNRQLSRLMVESSHMDTFLLYLQNDLKERIIKEEAQLHVYSSNDVDMLLNEENTDITEGIFDTPSRHYERPYMESSNSTLTPTTAEKPSATKESKLINNRMTPFGQRINKFISQFTLNAEITHTILGNEEPDTADDDIIRTVQPRKRCSLQVHHSKPETGCRFMYDTTENRFNSLENRIKRHANAFVASGLYGDPTDPTLASQKSLFAVGMICSDGEGRLNEKSILLQSSVEHSGGQRVRLDLQNVAQFSLFPGQVIGVEGNNPSGHCLIASKMIDSLPNLLHSGLPPAKKQAIDPEHEPSSPSSASRVLSMVIAAGPFTTTDNLLFEPFTELLAYASRKQPQLLILMGPFLDSEHPELKKGTVDRRFDDIFLVEILRKLQDYAEYMGPAARVILVPSTRDANHDFVFPQPAFDISLSEEIRRQITCVTNPGVLSANEITVGCCTVDILKQLSSEEISRAPAGAPPVDRMGQLATHILKQQNHYPLFPPSVNVPLDLSLAPEALEINSIPDVLLLPSDLAPFVKVLSHGEGADGEAIRCMCVNPGRLAKGIGGGTFVELNYSVDTEKSNASIIRI